MKKNFKNNYYQDEDEIHFERLNNFRKFNTRNKINAINKNHEVKYSNSDKNLFNNIIKTQENSSILNETDIKKEINYYNSSDFQKFEKLDNFAEYKNEKKDNNFNLNSEVAYTSNDYNQFDKITKAEIRDKDNNKSSNKKVKIIDFDKIKEKKIKIVYFD